VAGHNPWTEIYERDVVRIQFSFLVMLLKERADEVERGRFAAAPFTMQADDVAVGHLEGGDDLRKPLGEWLIAEPVVPPGILLRQIVTEHMRVYFRHLLSYIAP
jgi:hypothetical protein